MEKFNTLTGLAIPMPWNNVDTDMITPSNVLKTVSKLGLAWGFFQEFRFDENGAKKTDFILNQSPWDKGKIIVSLENWGCGSSREHAAWAMRDFGIRCVIACSIADIHYINCCKNGILPITLPADIINQLMEAAQAAQIFHIDLENCHITLADGRLFSFTIDEARRHALLNGIDEIAKTQQQNAKITAFEEQYRQKVPWLFTGPTD